MSERFGLSKEEPDFYEGNKGGAVNLYAEQMTFSGDIQGYDRGRGKVSLTNYLRRVYKEDGSSRFIEDEGIVEVDTHIIRVRETSSREDRLGRIAKYNQDLFIEEAERNKKLMDLQNSHRSLIIY